MKPSAVASQNKRAYSKNESRRTSQRMKRTTFPSHTYLADDLFHDLRHLFDLSCERTREHIAIRPARATFVRELNAFAYGLYVHSRNSLREHMRHVSSQVKADPIALWRWAQEQVSSAIAKSMPHDPQINLARAKLGLNRSAFQWTAEAFSDPRDCGLFFEDKWRAPAFMFEEQMTSEKDGTATKEQTASLVDEVQSQIVDALQNARYDAYRWLLERPREAKPRKYRSENKIRIVELFNRDPNASNVDVVMRLDDNGVPIPKAWKSDRVTNWVSALNSDSKFHDVESLINKVRRDLGITKR